MSSSARSSPASSRRSLPAARHAESEEAVICTMCHSLGRLLVVFFLYEESQQIRAREERRERGAGSRTGAGHHLSRPRHRRGAPLEFPRQADRGNAEPQGARDRTARDTRRSASRSPPTSPTISTPAALRSSQADKEAALAGAEPALQCRPSSWTRRISSRRCGRGLHEMAERSATLNLAVAHSPALNAVRAWAGQPAEAASAAPPDDTATHLIKQVNTVEAIESKASRRPPTRNRCSRRASATSRKR